MPLSSGSRLGPYEIQAAIGAGGMGEVYKARDTRLDRTVAVKILPAHLAAVPGFRERFQAEARAISAVEHRHICPLYDVGEEGGVGFLVMQYVEGETLAARIRGGPIPVAEAVALARQIALGLEAAHDRGILHRDLKPSNVQITPDGDVRLLDFGLATAVRAIALREEGDPSLSPTFTRPAPEVGLVLGSAAYMSPEQARGKPVDRRTDIWAFGCVLFEMLSGRPAFDGETIADVLAHVMEREPDWQRLPPATPRRLRRLLVRCLRKNPAHRLRDVADARLDLDEEEEDPAAAPPRTRAVPRWTMAAVAVLVALAALVALWATASRHRPSGMRFSTVTNFPGVAAQPSFSPDGRSVAFVSNKDGQWDIYVTLVTGGGLVRITTDANLEARPRWSPDGSRLLFARLNDEGLWDVWLVPALGGSPRTIVHDAHDPGWSRDGRSIAYSSRGIIWTSGVDGANPRSITRSELPINHAQPAFSHDGRSIIFVRRQPGPYGELAVVDVAGGAVRTVTRDRALAASPVWSPDDRSVYFSSSRGGTLSVWKIAAAAGEPEQITAGQENDAQVDLSADGRRLLFSTFRSNWNLAELSLDRSAQEPLKWLTRESARGQTQPRYSPDGRKILYFSTRSGAEPECITVMDADGANAAAVVADDRVNVGPRWGPDGEDVFFFSRPPGIEGGGELRRASLGGGAPQGLGITPWDPGWGDVAADGRLIYRTSAHDAIIYDPRTKRSEKVAGVIGEPRWSHDGRRFAFVVPPNGDRPGESGAWIGATDGVYRHVFRGWVVSCAWAAGDELLVLEGRPDLHGRLWRVGLDGRRELALADVPLLMRYNELANLPFDAHPDGRRIVIPALEFNEADIGMIDNVR